MGASSSPDISSATSIYGTTVGFALSTTVTTDLLTVSANKLLRITNLLVSNIDGTSSADVTLALVLADNDPNGVTDFDVDAGGPWYIVKTVPVPADSTLSILDAPRYLRAGDGLEGGARAASDLQLIGSYDVFDDA